ncbi:hypothetical protein TELCIR_24631, partial [Teladorsagia circumcincta]
MRIIILALLVAACVSADLFDLKKSLVVGSLKGLIKNEVNKKIKRTMDRIKEVFNSNMMDFRKKLSGYKEKILQKLHLTKEQRKELVERLKMFKRKTIDKVLSTGDTIEEINVMSKIAGALFQGDMGVNYFFDDSASAQVQSVFKKAAQQWMSDTCMNFIPSKFAQDSIRVFAEDGCWSFV